MSKGFLKQQKTIVNRELSTSLITKLRFIIILYLRNLFWE